MLLHRGLFVVIKGLIPFSFFINPIWDFNVWFNSIKFNITFLVGKTPNKEANSVD